MKIVITGTRGIPNILGGVESHCEQLFPLIANDKFKLIVVRRNAYITPDNKIKAYKGIVLKDIYSPRQKSFEAIVHTFLAVIYARLINARIVHIHAIGPAILTPLARLLGLKVVFTHHGADYERQKWGKFAKIILRLGERWGVKYANEVIVISKVIQNDIALKYRRTNVNIIPNGVSIPSISTQNEYVKSLGLEPNKYIIGVARFVPEKGFHDLIEAYKTLNTDYKLVLVGDSDHESEYSKSLKQKAKENKIILTGFIKGEKLNEIYSHAAIFVMPSYHEGLPIALLEALSYNLQVIVSDIPANLEVNIDKKNYFKVGDVDDLAKKLSEKIFYPIVYNYNDLITKNYVWDDIAKQTEKVYIKLLEKK